MPLMTAIQLAVERQAKTSERNLVVAIAPLRAQPRPA